LFEEVRGLSLWYTEPKRLHEIRWSFDQLLKETGVGAHDVCSRIPDYGLATFFPSHHPYLVPEPMTPEPTETYAKAEVEEYAAVINRVCEEAYTDPQLVLNAPHNSAWGKAVEEEATRFDRLATTRRASSTRNSGAKQGG
jgi:glycine dehydrogenase subunit 2